MNISYNIVGNGIPIIFIHGIGSRKYAWNGVIDKLKNEYQCISYDLRGHGESVFDESNFTLEDLVEDLENLRFHLNIDKTHLVGHSLGGMIGPAYSLKYPKHVLALGLFSTVAGRTKKDKEKILTVIKSMEDQGISKILPTLIKRWFTDKFVEISPDIVEQRIQQVINTDPEIFLNVFRIYANTEMSSWLHKIKFPTLIMTGENDEGCKPKLNKFIANKISNSKLVILPVGPVDPAIVNALLPIDITLFGIINVFNVIFAKAISPIVCNLLLGANVKYVNVPLRSLSQPAWLKA